MKIKRIGAYAYVTPLEDPFTRELGWYKDHSMRVVAMAAEAEMVRGIPVAEFIMGHRDPFDFMLSIKVPRSSRLEADGHTVQNTTLGDLRAGSAVNLEIDTVARYVERMLGAAPSQN